MVTLANQVVIKSMLHSFILPVPLMAGDVLSALLSRLMQMIAMLGFLKCHSDEGRLIFVGN